MGKFAEALKRWQEEGCLGPAPGPGKPQAIPEPRPRVGLTRMGRPSHLLINNGTAPAIIEQYKMLRTHLLHSQGSPRRTILVTSTLRAEGKSSVAANLAISIAQSVKECVLLMDCDLRQPSLHRLFGLHPTAGLADYLRGAASLSELLLRPEAKLSLLPAGAAGSDAAELLASDRMGSLLAEVKGRYEDRFIILDSAPLLLTADPALLATQVEAVLLVVRAGLANRELIARVVDTISAEKILGVVFNGVEPGPTSWARKYYESAYGQD